MIERRKMVAMFFGDGKYDDMSEEVYPHQGQTYRQSAQKRADDLAIHRESSACGWAWDTPFMRARENDVRCYS